MWNLISDLKVLRENLVPIYLTTIWWLDALRGTEEIIPKRLLNKGLKKPRLKFNSGLELIGLGTTRPSAQFDDACTLFLFTVFYILTETLSQKFQLFILFSLVRKMLREYARLETFKFIIWIKYVFPQFFV